MSSPAAVSLAILLGVLLAVGGIVMALVSGLDPLYGGIGASIATAGIVLAWRMRRANPLPEERTVVSGERSVQLPEDESESKTAKMNRRL